MSEEKEEPLVRKLFLCNCFTHGIVIDYDEADKEIYLSQWNSYRDRLSIFERIKHCLQILWTGEAYSEVVGFNRPTAKAFLDAFKEAVEKIEDVGE